MTPLLLIALASASPTAAAAPDDVRFRDCLMMVDRDPEAAIAYAGQWRVDGSLVLARQCLGMAYAAQQRWASAVVAFQQAAQASEGTQDGRAAGLWVQAGNAALAIGNFGQARGFFDAALALGTLTGADAGEARLDRARALVAMGDVKRARTDLEAAIGLVPEDPLLWLLSATLARRMGDLDRAQKDIAEAAKRAPDDASVALEAGNIAAMAGQDAAARTAWEAAIRLAPKSPQAQSAAAALAQFSSSPAEATPPQP